MEVTITFNLPSTTTYNITEPMVTYWDSYWNEVNATSISTDVTDGVATFNVAFKEPFDVHEYWFAFEAYGGHIVSADPGTYTVDVTISDGDLTYYNLAYPITIKSGINIDAGSRIDQTGTTDWLVTLITRNSGSSEAIYITGF
mmetsp:Transcript_34598/g.25763  ORF Transcript_34598/g.25763 Transcript_34598/m.25763 type:complete len:143 (-) Transcript_34598:792-1220(-)